MKERSRGQISTEVKHLGVHVIIDGQTVGYPLLTITKSDEVGPERVVAGAVDGLQQILPFCFGKVGLQNPQSSPHI